MKLHALFDFLHLLFLSIKSHYVFGIPSYVFLIPFIFVIGYIVIICNKPAQRKRLRSRETS
ncbi:hypothetical protein [Bacillus cereus]|uniref:hypothetical protein n=1 Tax=Bacillus cereus TaxID=1396 RepID=UPI0039805862